MGLASSLYSGTTGLKAHGEKMSVIGNNLANVSTIGYKGSRMDFEDAMSQAITTANGTGQVGRGVAVGAVMADFSQGSMKSTNEATDLAIGGDGFFMVSPKGEQNQFYTRAGNFRFDEDGYLVDPHGYVLQGWEVLEEDTSQATTTQDSAVVSTGVKTTGVPKNIRLENFQSPPEATSQVDMMVNLDSRAEDKSIGSNAGESFVALFNNWDATDPDQPIGDERYAYQNTIKVYDENGTSHDMTTYFDPVKNDQVVSNAGGNRVWEYMTTVSPDADNRSFWDSAASTEKKGVLMTGTLEFNSAGELIDMNAYTINNSNGGAGGPNDINSWQSANFSKNGYPICTANFTGTANADVTSQADAKNIAINFGLQDQNVSWETTGALSNASGTTDPGDLRGMGSGSERSALSTTNFSSGSTTLFQSQNGYTSGDLQNISVDRDGVVSGSYSNGQEKDLYVLTLADFNNKQALRREGGNLFSETRSSGSPLTGKPGTGGLGTVASNSLEQSNVDMADQFVKMITTQKGFQANSKTITSTDRLLSYVIRMKR